jgi:hypothetical protein
MEVIMNQNDALNVLVQAVNLAQAKGAYSLQEAAVITQAVTVFTPPAESTGTTSTTSTSTTTSATAKESTKSKKTTNKK